MKVKNLIVDTGAFIKQVNLWELGENLYTTPGVINEIRDRNTKQFIDSRLSEILVVKEPSAESCRFVQEFSTKTGDYPSLSTVDFKLAALAYELYVKEYGSSAPIKSIPEKIITKQIVKYYAPKPKSTSEFYIDSEGFYGKVKNNKENCSNEANAELNKYLPVQNVIDKLDSHLTENSFICGPIMTIEDNNLIVTLVEKFLEIRELALYIKNHGKHNAFDDICFSEENKLSMHFGNKPHIIRWLAHINSIPEEELDYASSDFAALSALKKKFLQQVEVESGIELEDFSDGSHCEISNQVVGNEETNSDEIGDDEESSDEIEDDESSDSSDETEDEESSDSSDSDGWVGPSNINEWKLKMDMSEDDETELLIGCITIDYAIQNVLKHMGLHVLGVDGRIINNLRSFSLRCYACKKLTRQMERVFCPSCGNNSLKKVAVTFENGVETIHINANKTTKVKGANRPIPPRRGGKHEIAPILVADQRIPKNFMTKKARNKTDITDPAYSSDQPFVTRDTYSKSAQLGLTRRNNARRRKNK